MIFLIFIALIVIAFYIIILSKNKSCSYKLNYFNNLIDLHNTWSIESINEINEKIQKLNTVNIDYISNILSKLKSINDCNLQYEVNENEDNDIKFYNIKISKNYNDITIKFDLYYKLYNDSNIMHYIPDKSSIDIVVDENCAIHKLKTSIINSVNIEYKVMLYFKMSDSYVEMPIYIDLYINPYALISELLEPNIYILI